MAERLPLTQLPTALIEAGYSDAPGYRHVYEQARSGRLPAKPNKAGRWTWVADDLPVIVDSLGLDTPAAA